MQIVISRENVTDVWIRIFINGKIEAKRFTAIGIPVGPIVLHTQLLESFIGEVNETCK